VHGRRDPARPSPGAERLAAAPNVYGPTSVSGVVKTMWCCQLGCFDT